MTVERSGNTVTMTPKEFRQYVIASDDYCHEDRNYEESGYVAVKVSETECYLSGYSHCSCYGTFEALAVCDYGNTCWRSDEKALLTFSWKGTWRDLVELARRSADPVLPDRDASKDDFDYDHLMAVYRQILELDKTIGGTGDGRDENESN